MQAKKSASTSRTRSTATTPQKQHPPPTETDNNSICLKSWTPNPTSTPTPNVPRANATRGKRAAASNAASGCSAAATAAAVPCVQLSYSTTAVYLMRWCGLRLVLINWYVPTWGSLKVPVLLRGHACVFRSTQTASHRSASTYIHVCQSAIQATGTTIEQ